MVNIEACKYGFCSYYLLARHEIESFQNVALVFEYDEEMKKDYFVHCSIYHNNDPFPFEDALGKYQTIEEMSDFTDVLVENLSYKVIPFSELKQFILDDLGFIEIETVQEIRELIHDLW